MPGENNIEKLAQDMLANYKELNDTKMYQLVHATSDKNMLLAIEHLLSMENELEDIKPSSILGNILLEVQAGDRTDLAKTLYEKYMEVFVDRALTYKYVSPSLLNGVFSLARERLSTEKLYEFSEIYLRTALDEGVAGNERGIEMLLKMEGMDISDVEIKTPGKGNKAIHFWAKNILTSEKPSVSEIEHHKELLGLLMSMGTDINEKAHITDNNNEYPIYTTALGWMCRVLDHKRENYAKLGIELLIQAGADWTKELNENKESGKFMLSLPSVASKNKSNQLIGGLPQHRKDEIKNIKPAKPKF